MTRRFWFTALAAVAVAPAAVAHWKRRQQRREFPAWLRGLEPIQARARERMREAGYNPDCEDDVTEYVDRVIHEYRAERRAKEQAG